MIAVEPRVQAPAHAAPNEIIQIRTIITHPMETGLRRGPDGGIVPRDIINKFTCRFDGAPVFSVDLDEGMSANPYFEFSMRATRSGRFQFTWEEDGGGLHTLETPLTVG
jgi:sulfur-oxidizing protein SoxZ